MDSAVFDPRFLQRLEKLRLSLGEQALASRAGARRSAALGPGIEFSDFRAYVHGDDPRRIDWNAFARFDQPFVRLFNVEQTRPIAILLDASASMNFGRPNKFTWARRMAAALVYLAVSQRDEATLLVCRAGQTPPPPRFLSRSDMPRCLEFLSGVAAAGPGDFANEMAQAANRVPTGAAVFAISDLLAATNVEASCKRIRYGKHALLLFQTLSPGELFPEQSGPTRLADAETGEEIDVYVDGKARAAYEKRLGKFLGDVRQACHRHEARHVLARTDDAWEKILPRELARRTLSEKK